MFILFFPFCPSPVHRFQFLHSLNLSHAHLDSSPAKTGWSTWFSSPEKDTQPSVLMWVVRSSSVASSARPDLPGKPILSGRDVRGGDPSQEEKCLLGPLLVYGSDLRSTPAVDTPRRAVFPPWEAAPEIPPSGLPLGVSLPVLSPLS